MSSKHNHFDEAVFLAASYLAEDMVKNSSARILGADKYEFIHRAKKEISEDLSKINEYSVPQFSIGMKDGSPDLALANILAFKPELVNHLSKDIRIVINIQDDYSTFLMKGNNAYRLS